MFGGGRQHGPSVGTTDDSIIDEATAQYLRTRLVEALSLPEAAKPCYTCYLRKVYRLRPSLRLQILTHIRSNVQKVHLPRRARNVEEADFNAAMTGHSSLLLETPVRSDFPGL